jgi:DNA-binding IclR family transcriptional regulator
MSPAMKTCLARLAILPFNDHWDEDAYYSFARIADGTGLDRATVRRAVRALARKGLAEYAKALCDIDGRFAGAGYRITAKGREMALEAAHDHS